MQHTQQSGIKSGLNPLRLINEEGSRSILIQGIFLLLLILAVLYLGGNAQEKLAAQGKPLDFGFMWTESNYDISFYLIDYDSTYSHWRAYFVGLLNTLLVAFCGVIAATIIGFILGVTRLSNNWLLSRLSYCFVEFARNVPVLLHIFLTYSIIIQLPKVRDSIALGSGVFLNNRGLFFPKLLFEDSLGILIGVGFVVACVAIFILKRISTRRKDLTGTGLPIFPISLIVFFGLPALIILLSNQSIGVETPTLKGFNFTGGIALRPEFFALWLALSLYTSAFIAEIVRSGIVSVSKGQWEAAESLGLTRGTILWQVVVPQALRVIIPPLNSQYLNLAKNSSLAPAIGYMDLMATTGGITLNQSGQAFICLIIVMLTYLTISLFISLYMNWYNRAIALTER